MPGFDWNGNGKSDAFDHFMDMKVISDVYESDNGCDTDDFDINNNTDIYDDNDDAEDLNLGRSELLGALRSVAAQNNESKHNKPMNFQDELKKNLRSPEVVKKENEEKKTNYVLETAKYDLSKIKSKLIENAKNAQYTIENGMTTVTCLYEDYYKINRYMRTSRLDNGNEIAQNQKKFALLRDPNLVYCVWKNFQIEPKYSDEYFQYSTTLKRVAAEENIQIEFVVHNSKTNEIYPFPSKIRDNYNMTYCQLCVRASTVIGGSSSNGGTQVKTVESPKMKQPTKSYTAPQTQQSTTNNSSKRSDGEVLLRSIIVIALCIVAFAICLAGGVGKLGMGLLLIGAAILGYNILK